MKIISITSKVITILFLLSFMRFGYAEESVYGWQLMNEQERAEHRAKMRSFATNEEREAYRLEHHEMMQLRAKEQGVALPEKPTPRGKGMGGGMGGPGPGPGPGSGMGGGGR